MMKNKFLYMNVYDSIKKQIMNKEKLADEKLPTELEMEEIYNVSRITIKKALAALKKDGYIYSIRGSGSYVSPDMSTDETPEETISNCGCNLVTIVLPSNMAESNFVNTINGASEYLSEKGYHLTVRSNVGTVEEEKEILEQSYENVAGVLLLPLSTNENFHTLNKLYLNKYPLVMLDRYNEYLPINYVVTDNYQGGYDATQYLLSQGHEKIAFLCDVAIEKYTTLRNRYLGYCKALEEAGHLDSELIHIGLHEGYTHEPNPELFSGVVKKIKSQGATAIFAANDLLATYLISEAEKLDMIVPDDLSIIGFDNDPFLARYFPKAITTMGQAYYDMGKIAAENIIELIQGKNNQVKVKLPTTLVEKDTVKSL